jgi:hypothetical protein
LTLDRAGGFAFERTAVVLPAKLAFDHVIAHRLPTENEVPFFRASGSLASGAIMDMDMRSAVRNGVILRHMPFKALVQIPSLSNVDGNPTAVLGLSGINVIA